MNIAIIYSSKTGNTKRIADAIKEIVPNENLVYFGAVTKELPRADLYIIGSWTDKGNPTNDIVEALRKIKNKKIAYFGTAGYGGSKEYYEQLFERVKINIDLSNEIIGYFYCQGKMPMQTKAIYETKLSQNPKDVRVKAFIKNFDKALSHPDAIDIYNAKHWIQNQILNKNSNLSN